MTLPDIGAKGGLCGENWATHAGRWAHQRGHKPVVDMFPTPKVVIGVGKRSQSVPERATVPVGLVGTSGKKHLSSYRAAVVRDSNLPALMGSGSLEKMNAVIKCRTGEIWVMDDQGCSVTPKGRHVHLQMKKGATGHWYLPVGRFSDALAKFAGGGHLATTSVTPANVDASAAASASQ